MRYSCSPPRSGCRVSLSLALLLAVAASAAESPFLYGIHDADPAPTEFLNHIKTGTGGTGGWVTATVAVGASTNDFGGADFSALANAGHTVICRINYGYFPDGSIPVAAKYDDFATRCKNFVAHTTGCTIWLIGNESNLNAEWPFDSSNNRFNYVSPQDYANCFRKVYDAIKSIRPNDKVMPQALAPWGGPYGGTSSLNGSGYPADGMPLNWVTYLNQMLSAIAASGPLDGIPLHIGSRGYTYSDIHSTSQVNAGGQDLYFSFYVYKDWIDYGIPPALYHLPLYVTECNGLYYWKGGGPPGEDPTKHYEAGWMQEIFAEFNRYNQSAATNGKPIFRCVNFYRWCAYCDGWNIDGGDNPYKAQILSDLDASVAQLYRWPTNSVSNPSNNLPDVVVTSISWTPANPLPGSNVVFSARVLNQGTAPTPSGVTLGVGFLVDSVQVSWAGGYSLALAPGDAITLTADGGPSGVNYWTAATGNHTITANVDDINRFPESYEGNNISTSNLVIYAASYAINAGGGASGSYAADNYWTGSANTYSVTNIIDTSGVSNAAPQGVYQTERWGTSTYTFSPLVPGASYRVRLHWAEISPSVSGTGDRRFHVVINGSQVLTNFDIYAAAGGKFKAVARQFTTTANGSGQVVLQFLQGASNEAKIGGIEIAPVLPPLVCALSRTSGSAILRWASFPAKLYRVEYRATASGGGWNVLGNDLVATGSSLSVTNGVTGIPRRYYRVRQMN